MPFDDMSLRTPVVLDQPPEPIIPLTLAALGIIPVARDVAERHKSEYTAGYAARHPDRMWELRAGVIRWRTIPLRSLSELKQTPPYASEPHAAPTEVIDLARTVKKHLPDAKFELEYFYTDPILNVMYHDRLGGYHHDCLGIWDQGVIVALANDTKAFHRRLPKYGVTGIGCALLGIGALAFFATILF